MNSHQILTLCKLIFQTRHDTEQHQATHQEIQQHRKQSQTADLNITGHKTTQHTNKQWFKTKQHKAKRHNMTTWNYKKQTTKLRLLGSASWVHGCVWVCCCVRYVLFALTWTKKSLEVIELRSNEKVTLLLHFLKVILSVFVFDFLFTDRTSIFFISHGAPPVENSHFEKSNQNSLVMDLAVSCLKNTSEHSLIKAICIVCVGCVKSVSEAEMRVCAVLCVCVHQSH